jgi:hypothetical protein
MILNETAYFRIYLNKTKRSTLGQQGIYPKLRSGISVEGRDK